MKFLRYKAEALFMVGILTAFKLMPPKTASNIGGAIGRTIGPRLATSRKALRHITYAFPDMAETDKHAILVQMWDNLGRLIGEYPHLQTLAAKHSTIEGLQHFTAAKDKSPNMIFFGAHLGNWEMNCLMSKALLSHEVDMTYRAPNNPHIDRMLMNARSPNGIIKGYPKSAKGGRAMLKALKDKRSLGILIDQKYNQGLPISFFGKTAMTNPACVQFAQKFKIPLVPIQAIRKDKTHYIMRIHPEIPTYAHDGTKRPLEEVLTQCTALTEEWIKENPGQWLWLHRRWKNK